MKLAVVMGATREGRKTERQAKWVANAAKQVEDTEVELLDLNDYPLPFFYEAIPPRYNPGRKPEPAAQKWLDKIAEFDAYIFVTPEYNHSIPAVLKNAIDFLDWQLKRKPVAVISHGAAGGARAATDLKEILSGSSAAVIPVGPSLSVLHMTEIIDEDGNMSEEAKANPYGPQTDLEALLTELKWYSDALAAARQ